MLFLALGLVGCGSQRDKKAHAKGVKGSSHAQSGKGQFDQELEEFELIDELEDDFFQDPAASRGMNNDDFAWVDVDVAQPREILFDFNKDEIRPDQQTSLDRAAVWARDVNKRGNVLVIEGHADAIGKNRVYNLALSERRAQSVAHELVKKHVSKKRINVVGRGQEMQKVIADLTVEKQAPNRRVEFYEVTATKKAVA